MIPAAERSPEIFGVETRNDLLLFSFAVLRLSQFLSLKLDRYGQSRCEMSRDFEIEHVGKCRFELWG